MNTLLSNTVFVSEVGFGNLLDIWQLFPDSVLIRYESIGSFNSFPLLYGIVQDFPVYPRAQVSIIIEGKEMKENVVFKLKWIKHEGAWVAIMENELPIPIILFDKEEVRVYVNVKQMEPASIRAIAGYISNKEKLRIINKLEEWNVAGNVTPPDGEHLAVFESKYIVTTKGLFNAQNPSKIKRKCCLII